jgi:hypothetical protein
VCTVAVVHMHAVQLAEHRIFRCWYCYLELKSGCQPCYPNGFKILGHLLDVLATRDDLVVSYSYSILMFNHWNCQVIKRVDIPQSVIFPQLWLHLHCPSPSKIFRIVILLPLVYFIICSRFVQLQTSDGLYCILSCVWHYKKYISSSILTLLSSLQWSNLWSISTWT